MFKLQYLSDLHLENREINWWIDQIIPKAKYLILAGDICPVFDPKLQSFYRWCSNNFDKTIHIPGNHEYWDYRNIKHTMNESEAYMKSLCYHYNIIYGQKKIIKLEEGYPALITCTLWSKLEDHINHSNDFVRIKDLNLKRRNTLFKDHVKFIAKSINKQRIKPIIATHYAPLLYGVQRPEHQGSPETSLYTSDLSSLVDKSMVWVFGHTHHVTDITTPSGSIVTSNAIGNPNEHLPYNKSAIIRIRNIN